MNISINDKVLREHGLSVEEFLVLYLCAKDTNIEETINSLIKKGICEKNLYNNVSAVASNNTKNLISSILINSDREVINKDKEFKALAEKMRGIFPEGKKPGTTYMWRDSAPIVAEKLKTLVTKFNFHFTEEQAISATQRYVDSFNGNYKFMHILRYFILKRDNNAGELKSEFMSLIENPEDTAIVENDFVKMR